MGPEIKERNHDIFLSCIYIAVYPTKLYSVVTCRERIRYSKLTSTPAAGTTSEPFDVKYRYRITPCANISKKHLVQTASFPCQVAPISAAL
jgi:hypothetical protein